MSMMSMSSMSMSKAAGRLVVPAILLLALSLAFTACSGDGGAQPESSPSVDVGGGDPATESTGAAEQPTPSAGGSTGIAVAALPVVGGKEEVFENSGVQCVRVNWKLPSSGTAIPSGLAVNITGATYQPDVFRPIESPCEAPPCIGFSFKLSEVVCDLPIQSKDPGATRLSDSQQVTVSLQGRVLCTDYESAPCKAFTGAVRGTPRTLKVRLPIVP